MKFSVLCDITCSIYASFSISFGEEWKFCWRYSCLFLWEVRSWSVSNIVISLACNTWAKLLCLCITMVHVSPWSALKTPPEGHAKPTEQSASTVALGRNEQLCRKQSFQINPVPQWGCLKKTTNKPKPHSHSGISLFRSQSLINERHPTANPSSSHRHWLNTCSQMKHLSQDLSVRWQNFTNRALHCPIGKLALMTQMPKQTCRMLIGNIKYWFAHRLTNRWIVCFPKLRKSCKNPFAMNINL